MANNYVQSSSMLEIPKDKRDKAQEIIDKFFAQFTDADDPAGVQVVNSTTEDGVWIYGEEWFDADQAAELAQNLLDGLEIDKPFIFSWAYTCSRLRINEFGGGACLVRRGKPPLFIDAYNHLQQLINTKPCLQDTPTK